MLENLNPTNYKIKETHLFAINLSEKYYGPGSYNNWIRLGWALKNTSELLFLTWLKLSSNDNCRNTLKGENGKSITSIEKNGRNIKINYLDSKVKEIIFEKYLTGER